MRRGKRIQGRRKNEKAILWIKTGKVSGRNDRELCGSKVGRKAAKKQAQIVSIGVSFKLAGRKESEWIRKKNCKPSPLLRKCSFMPNSLKS